MAVHAQRLNLLYESRALSVLQVALARLSDLAAHILKEVLGEVVWWCSHCGFAVEVGFSVFSRGGELGRIRVIFINLEKGEKS